MIFVVLRSRKKISHQVVLGGCGVLMPDCCLFVEMFVEFQNYISNWRANC